MAEWLRAGRNEPSRAQIEAAARVLSGGGTAILPTDTIYGLHARATDAAGIGKLFAAKRRPATQALAVICADIDQIRELGVIAPSEILDALGRLWPAPLSAVLPLETPIAASAGRNTIAVRIPALGWLRELLRETNPLASTSVNLSGERAIYSTNEIPAELRAAVDIVLDCGELRAASSTLVDFTTAPPTVLREGEFGFTQNLWKSVWKSR